MSDNVPSDSVELLVGPLPDEVAESLPTISSRLDTFLTYYSTLNLSRLERLHTYLTKAEAILFDESTLASLSYDEILKNYKAAKEASVEILELARKVSVQSKQFENKKLDELYSFLSSLSMREVNFLTEKIQQFKDGE